MTMIRIALIAAAVFFIVICIVAVIVVKKESRRRTDSLKAIEKSISKISQELARELRERNDIAMDLNEDVHYMVEASAARLREEAMATVQPAVRPADEVDTVIEETNAAAEKVATEIHDSSGFDEIELNIADSTDNEEEKEEISFDFLGLDDLDDLDGMDELLFNERNVGPAEEYITGRSGRRYTAEELEELIRE